MDACLPTLALPVTHLPTSTRPAFALHPQHLLHNLTHPQPQFSLQTSNLCVPAALIPLPDPCSLFSDPRSSAFVIDLLTWPLQPLPVGDTLEPSAGTSLPHHHTQSSLPCPTFTPHLFPCSSSISNNTLPCCLLSRQGLPKLGKCAPSFPYASPPSSRHLRNSVQGQKPGDS